MPAPGKDSEGAAAAAPAPVRVEITVAEDGVACGSPTRLRLLADDPEDDPAQALDSHAQHASAPLATGSEEHQSTERGEAESSEDVDRARTEEACGGDADSREPIAPVLVGASPVKPPVCPRQHSLSWRLVSRSCLRADVPCQPCSGQTCTPAATAL